MLGATGKKKKKGGLKRTDSNESAVHLLDRLEQRVDNELVESCQEEVLHKLIEHGVKEIPHDSVPELVKKAVKALGNVHSADEFASWILNHTLPQ